MEMSVSELGNFMAEFRKNAKDLSGDRYLTAKKMRVLALILAFLSETTPLQELAPETFPIATKIPLACNLMLEHREFLKMVVVHQYMLSPAEFPCIMATFVAKSLFFERKFGKTTAN